MKVNEGKKKIKKNMTRKGKIARLPHNLREQINLRLQDGKDNLIPVDSRRLRSILPS
jgi:hypothetical protein